MEEDIIYHKGDKFKFYQFDFAKDNKYGYIFKKDKEFFDKYLKEGQWSKETNKEKEKDNLDKGIHSDKCFQFGLRPQQIVGNMKEAKIFLLNLNPSFDVEKYLDFDDEEKLKDILEEVLASNGSPNIEYPFYFLNPELKDTGGETWWNNGHHFKSYIEECYDIKKLAKLFCCIELIPYHARKLPISINKMLECPSVKNVKDFVREVLIPKAKKEDIVIICLRSKKYWDIEKEINDKSYNVYFSPNPQRANFSINNEKSEHVKKIKELINGDK